ncbi:hypothetical protein IC582_015253 [Cucumis melo]
MVMVTMVTMGMGTSGSMLMVGEGEMARPQLQVIYLNVKSTIFAKFFSNKDIVIAKWI